MECIPDELLFDILSRLRAQDIYSGARLVCRKWYHMIHTHNFISTHLQHASYGLLCGDGHRGIDFISVRNGDIETYKLMNYKKRLPYGTSCNGLVLEAEGSSGNVYCVTNISTDQSIRLPPYPVSGILFVVGMGYAASSGTYKVVVIGVWRAKRCGMLTVGVDKSWRFNSVEHLSPFAVNALCFRPFVNEGFMHWISGRTLVTLNVETETITEAPLSIPAAVGENNRSIHYLETGTYLSLLISYGELEWEIWEMKSETGEWKKLPNICLESDKGWMKGFIPGGWVKYPEVLAFKHDYGGRFSVCFYDLVKREISSKKVDTPGGSYTLKLHKNSLVSRVGWRMLS